MIVFVLVLGINVVQIQKQKKDLKIIIKKENKF